MKDFGDKLFDDLSEAAIMTLEEGICFDSAFYEDQNDPSLRKLIIETVKDRGEFVVKEKDLADRKSRKFARKLSALGQSIVVKYYCDSVAEIMMESK